MTLPATNYETAVKKLRSVVNKISGIPLSLILNADSVRGPDPFKILSESETASPTLDDPFVVFSLDENPDGVYGAARVNDLKAETLVSYNFNIHIYGYPSHDKAQQLLFGFKSAAIASGLRDAGVYISGVSNIFTIKEFFNNTVWPRCDLTVQVACRNEFVQKDSPNTESFTWPVKVITT